MLDPPERSSTGAPAPAQNRGIDYPRVSAAITGLNGSRRHALLVEEIPSAMVPEPTAMAEACRVPRTRATLGVVIHSLLLLGHLAVTWCAICIPLVERRIVGNVAKALEAVGFDFTVQYSM